MAIKPWYKVVTPREDLREGRPLDAAEFAVHLDHVRDGRASEVYQNPEQFFERTYLTKNLTLLASQVLRRLSGETTETSAVFNMATQFGGGKTHALTLLYHLAKNGPKSAEWTGVRTLRDSAGVDQVPSAEAAVFVGTEFDSIQGRGGDDGTPRRMTPWGEVAFQLGGAEAFSIVEKHDREGIAPAGDVIRAFLPKDRPALILLDELMNYVSRSRKSGLSAQLYDFLHNLSETARGQQNVALVVSIPASELEMTAEDEMDYNRFKKLLDRLGKPIVMSAESETAEIIRRRLFEWDLRAVGQDGKVLLNKDAIASCNDYADWLLDHKQQISKEFPVEAGRSQFAATYPFHPVVLSVFERKWQTLPRFQQTRGVLRLLAQWVSNAFQEGFKGAHRDGLIGLGTAPLDDPLFRRAVFEQLGDDRLEGAITTDIIGKPDSFALRLDAEAVDTIKKARLHRKVATSIFFESSGGQQHKEASLPELRLAVAEPGLDLGNIETVLEELESNCYFLTVQKNRYRFSLTPNLNKLLSDRRANIKQERIDERVKEEIQKIFSQQKGVERIYFPERSNQVPDRPVITIVVLAPDRSLNDSDTLTFIEQITREYGTSGRTYKSALIWSVSDSGATLNEEARKLLAWEDIDAEESDRLDDSQRSQLSQSLKKGQRDLREAVWRSYKNIALLGRDNQIRTIDLGLVHSSAADSMAGLILGRLRQEDEAVDGVNPNFLVRNWPPALTEWSTRAVRDAFFASPKFPRLLIIDKLKETITRGVANGILAYAGRRKDGRFDPFFFEEDIDTTEIEFSDDMFILTADEAKKCIEPPSLKYLEIRPERAQVEVGKSLTFTVKGLDQHGQDFPLGKFEWSATGGEINQEGVFLAGQNEGEFTVTARCADVASTVRIIVAKEGAQPEAPQPPKTHGTLRWSGEVPPQKWMHFYSKVLAKFVNSGGLTIRVGVDVSPEGGISPQQVEEMKAVLRELGLNCKVESN